MKKVCLLLLLSIISCAINQNAQDNQDIEVFKKETYDNYTLLYGMQERDTVVLISNTVLLKECKWSFKYIKKQGLKEIPNIVTQKGDSLIFVYTTKDANNKFMVKIGGGEPGQKTKRYIYSYSRYPLYIDSCKPFK